MSPNLSTDKPLNPNEHLAIPKWINKEYFQPIVAKDVPNFQSITKLTPVAATPPGENYTSIMVRVLIEIKLLDGSDSDISYILKTALNASGNASTMIAVMELFPKECEMYSTLLPAFEKLYHKAGIDLKLAPKCVFIEKTPNYITLVFEDLSRRNFKNLDRLKGFDMKHMHAVLRKLAEMHAASAVQRENNGPYGERFYKSVYSEENRNLFEGMAESRVKSFLQAMQQWGLEDVEEYIKIIPSWDMFFDEGIRLNEVDPTHFNVLNHGDCWANNIMFNNSSSGDIDEVLFIDFQIGKYGTPAHDLWYLIVTSASLDIKLKEFDNFIKIYHDRLVECLELLNYGKSIPTLKELHIMMLQYGFWAYLTAAGVLTAILLPTDKDSNMENLLKPGPEGDAFRLKTFTNPYYAKAMCQLLPFLRNKGLLAVQSKEST